MAIVSLESKDIVEFKLKMQEAFQYGYESIFGPCNSLILPERDIDTSLNAINARSYVSVDCRGEILGGAIVSIDNVTSCCYLEFLFVDCKIQNRGVGFELWNYIEITLHDIKKWETVTPYFDKRNIHFYVNKLKFHIIEFFGFHHPMPETPDKFIGDGSEGMFRLEKNVR